MHNDINDSVNELFAPSSGGKLDRVKNHPNDDSFAHKNKNNIDLEMSQSVSDPVKGRGGRQGNKRSLPKYNEE